MGPGFTMGSAAMLGDVNPPTTIPAPQFNTFESRLQDLASADRWLPPPPPRHQGARGHEAFNQCPRRSEEQTTQALTARNGLLPTSLSYQTSITPKLDPITFDGNPMDYPMFMH